MNYKSIRHILIISLVCTLFLSCSSGDYLMETSYVSGLCIVKGDQPVSLLSDDGMILNPVSSDDLEGFIDGDRVLVTYNIVGEGQNLSKDNYQVKIYDIQAVPILDVIDRSELDANIEDPVWLLSKPWIGGGFMNIEFSFGHSDSNIKHGIYMVYDKFETRNGKNIIYLTFGHNAKGDSSTTNSPAFTSFRIESIENFQKADSVIVSVLEGTKVVTYYVALK